MNARDCPVDRDQFQLGTLSHFINARAAGYKELPDFPAVAPDPTVRSVPGFSDTTPKHKPDKKKTVKPSKKSFYSSGSDGEEGESEDESEEEGSESEEESTDENVDKKCKEGEESDEESSSSSEEESGSSDEESDSEEDTDSDDEVSSSSEESSESEKEAPKKTAKIVKTKPESFVKNSSVVSEVKITAKPTPPSNLDLLLGLDEVPPSLDTPMLTPSLGGFLPSNPADRSSASSSSPAPPAVSPGHCLELLGRMAGGGLVVKATFTRSPHLYCPKMAAIQLSFTNSSEEVSLHESTYVIIIVGLCVCLLSARMTATVFAFPKTLSAVLTNLSV